MTDKIGLGERAARRVEKGWCQHSSAEDKYGKPVFSSSSEAVKWCARGALVCESINPDGAFSWFEGYLVTKTKGKFGNLTSWNDVRGRTKKQVAALLRKLPAEQFP